MAKNRDVLPSAEIIAKFDTYEAAVEHVEKLLNGDFPVRQIAIVGRGIRTVERLRSRIGYPRMALNGAINGILIGFVWHVLTSSATDAGSYASTVITFAGISEVKAAEREIQAARNYLDSIIACRVVDGLDGAIDHIETHGSHHTDCIGVGNRQRPRPLGAASDDDGGKVAIDRAGELA